MKYFQICKFCKKRRFKVERQSLTIPIGQMVFSKDPMCRKCADNIEKAVNLK